MHNLVMITPLLITPSSPLSSPLPLHTQRRFPPPTPARAVGICLPLETMGGDGSRWRSDNSCEREVRRRRDARRRGTNDDDDDDRRRRRRRDDDDRHRHNARQQGTDDYDLNAVQVIC